MNRREIIETLKDMLDATGLGHCSNQPECIAINAAIDAINQFAEDNNVPIKQPGLEWVKTADRLPTKADAGVDEEIVTIYDDGETRIMGADYWAYVAKVPERFLYWLPVPKLPEVEE